jgi:acetyl-CoA decarbonylase/synthase complex subunit gamma
VTERTGAGLILMDRDPAIIEKGLEVCPGRRPLLYMATEENADRMAALAKGSNCPLAAGASSLDKLAVLTGRLNGLGVKEIVLDSGARTLGQAFQDQIIIRSAALAKKFRPLGFPTIVFPSEMTADPDLEAVIASIFIAKYGGIIVLSDFRGEALFPLLVARQNIFTDPQRPLATAEGIYPIGNPDANSPVLITSNFSLTYFIVSSEIETSRVPTWLLVKDTEGLSVVTAWAAGKFVADTIAPFVKRSGIADKVSHRKLVIPGYAAAESGGLEEELPGWEIIVGPKEGAAVPTFLKTWRAGRN